MSTPFSSKQLNLFFPSKSIPFATQSFLTAHMAWEDGFLQKWEHDFLQAWEHDS